MGSFVIRHKFRFIDFTAVALLVFVAAYAAWALDIFTNGAGEAPQRQTFEVDELVAVSVLLLTGMVWAIGRLRRERREVARRIAVEHQIRQLAFHDDLTGLPNRRQFDDALRAAAAAPPRAGGSHGVFMLDLNGFKRVNNVFGHPVGDEVLMQVAARLTAAVREGDLVARLGGDEFGVLSTHMSGAEAATGLAGRIIEQLRAPIPAGGASHSVGVAIGISLTPQNGNDTFELLRKADIALYRAKLQAGSAMCFFEEEMDVHVRERDQLERELKNAIEDHTIVPFYQPLVDLVTGRIRGFEALARWTHPRLGEIGPERFIPIAEDSGLIGPLTDQLLVRACADASGWPGDVELAVNVSPVLLRDPGFGLKVIGILGRAGFPLRRMELEITESALVRDLEAAAAALSALRDSGMKIALDDFGTGYSSLYHLRNFKADRIKIDRSFVASMSSDKDSAAIVKALVGLGAGLGLEVTAEGVETEEQRLMLAGDGCKQGQGFLYSKAVDAADALALLGRDGARRLARV